MKPVKFEIGEDSGDIIYVEERGENAWAITDGRNNLGTEGWEYEYSPSARTIAFIKRTRFKTPEEARDFYLNWKSRHEIEESEGEP